MVALGSNHCFVIQYLVDKRVACWKYTYQVVEVAAVNQGYEISVDSEIALNATLERALEKGIILYFATKLTLEDSRWFLVNDEVARAKLRVALRYYALTRQYQLNYLSSSQNFNSLKEALKR